MIVKIVKELIISIISIMLMLVIVRIYIIKIQIQIQIQMDIKINGIINYINNLSYLITIKISITK